MNVLVTGAGGFLGHKVAEMLIAKGHHVYNFSRSKYSSLEKLGVHCLQGDLKNYAEVELALRGKNIVFHIAAKVGMWGKYSEFYEANILGTENIIKGCHANQVAKLIFTSSPSVVFGNDDLENVDESIAYPKKYYSDYAKTKAIAEKRVLAANGQYGLSTCALRPHLIFGPGDPNLIPTLVASARKKKLKIVGNGDNLVDVIYIDNAAKAHIQAMEHLSPNSSVAGKAYFIAQEKPVNLWEFINKILKIYRQDPIVKKINFKNAFYIGRAMESLYRGLHKYDRAPPMTAFMALQLAKSHYFNHANAKADFNYRPSISIDQGLERLQGG